MRSFGELFNQHVLYAVHNDIALSNRYLNMFILFFFTNRKSLNTHAKILEILQLYFVLICIRSTKATARKRKDKVTEHLSFLRIFPSL